jgi:hypothetical protein
MRVLLTNTSYKYSYTKYTSSVYGDIYWISTDYAVTMVTVRPVRVQKNVWFIV